MEEYAQTHWTPDRVWVQLAVFSVITAAALIHAFRRRWRRAWFWMSFVGVMLIRTGVYVALLHRFPDWPVVLFAVVTVIEVQVLLVVLYWLNYGGASVAR